MKRIIVAILFIALFSCTKNNLLSNKEEINHIFFISNTPKTMVFLITKNNLIFSCDKCGTFYGFDFSKFTVKYNVRNNENSFEFIYNDYVKLININEYEYDKIIKRLNNIIKQNNNIKRNFNPNKNVLRITYKGKRESIIGKVDFYHTPDNYFFDSLVDIFFKTKYNDKVNKFIYNYYRFPNEKEGYDYDRRIEATPDR